MTVVAEMFRRVNGQTADAVRVAIARAKQEAADREALFGGVRTPLGEREVKE